MTAATQRHDEQAWLAVFSGARIKRQRSFAVIDLRFLTGFGFKAALCVRFIGRFKRAHETLYSVVRSIIAVALDEVLVDRRRVTAFAALVGDEGTMRFANATPGYFRCLLLRP